MSKVPELLAIVCVTIALEWIVFWIAKPPDTTIAPEEVFVASTVERNLEVLRVKDAKVVGVMFVAEGT